MYTSPGRPIIRVSEKVRVRKIIVAAIDCAIVKPKIRWISIMATSKTPIDPGVNGTRFTIEPILDVTIVASRLRGYPKDL